MRHLRRWPSRGIHCYRLYERDIPDVPLAIDCYHDWLHITEYARPHQRTEEQQTEWLAQLVDIASEVAGIQREQTIFKSRTKVAAKSGRAAQYQKLNQQDVELEVEEQGLKFLVNLSDYVDTGLFLDHRLTRDMVRKRAFGKDFLNLFGYTGSFSVYAAAGGARSTVTVDLSARYLDWAGKNFELNQLLGPQHRFVAMDAMDYLSSISNRGALFDLAVVDPPTYSNSKKTEIDWDVQKRHVELLRLLEPLIKPGGGVYFSTNFRKFKLDESGVPFRSREISNQTVPEDFRNQRIHRCWWLTKNESPT